MGEDAPRYSSPDEKRIMMSYLSAELLGSLLVGIATYHHGNSIWMTFKHAFGPKFEAPEFGRHGKTHPKHPRYHAWRGRCLAVGASLVLNLIANAPKADRSPFVFCIACLTCASYYIGWWGCYPFGLRTPHPGAERTHQLGAVLTIAGLCCSPIVL